MTHEGTAGRRGLIKVEEKFEAGGLTLTVKEWALYYKVTVRTIRRRLIKTGLPTPPVRKKKEKSSHAKKAQKKEEIYSASYTTCGQYPKVGGIVGI